MTNKWILIVYIGILAIAGAAIATNLSTLFLCKISNFISLDYWGFNSSRSETIRNLVIILATPLALWFAVKRTNTATRQANLAEKGQIIDRFQKSVEMLGNGNKSVREAGVFILAEIGKLDADNHYFPIQNVLCAFIRDQSSDYILQYKTCLERDGNYRVHPFENCPSDIEEALLALSALRTPKNLSRERLMNWSPNLNGAYFHGLNHSSKLNLSNSNLRGAILNKASFRECDFSGSLMIVEALETTFWHCNFLDSTFAHTPNAQCNFNENTNFTKCNFQNTNARPSDFVLCAMHDNNITGSSLTRLFPD